MSLFDNVSQGKIQFVPSESAVFNESASEMEELELFQEALYPDTIPELKVVRRQVLLPRGTPAGKHELVYLYSPDFKSSCDLMAGKENFKSGGVYKRYWYPMMYQGTIGVKRYRIRNLNVRKNYYAEMKKLHYLPYVKNELDDAVDKNIYVDLHTHLEILTKYSAALSIRKKVEIYWNYLKPIFLQKLDFHKQVLIPISKYKLGKKLTENLNHPLYMLYYTAYKFPQLLEGLDIDFYYFTGNAILKIIPSKLMEDGSASALRIQMNKLMTNIPAEAFSKEAMEKEEAISATVEEKKAEVDTEKEEVVDLDDVKTLPEEKPSEITKKITAKTTATKKAVDKVVADDTDKGKAKDVVNMMVDDQIKADQEILMQAYNKAKLEKISSTPKSSARDAKLLEEQQNLKINGVTLKDITNVKAANVKVQPKDLSKAVVTPNKNMKQLSFYQRNQTYVDQVMPKDIVDSIMELNNKSIPLFIRDIKVEDTSDEMNYKDTYTIYLEDVNRQRHTVKLDFPKVLEGRFIYLGGGKKYIKNQSYFYPVVKTKEDTVQLVSNYNKMFIQRKDTKSISSVERLKRLVKQDETFAKYFTVGNAYSANRSGSYITTIEYDELSKSYDKFRCKDLKIFFSQLDIDKELEKRNIKRDPSKLYYGFRGQEVLTVNVSRGQKNKENDTICDTIFKYLPEELQKKYEKIPVPKRLMYAMVKVMEKYVGVGMLIGFWEGLETILKKTKARWRLENKKVPLGPDEVGIRFKDCYLIYKDDVEVSLILNDINAFDTSAYNFTDFNEKDPYMKYLTKVYGSSNIANALMNFYEWFIDPVTREILTDLNLPTELVDLIIYAIQLLADSQYTSQLNQRISRIRNFEVMPMALYEVLARGYVAYRNSNGRKKFSVQQDAVIKTILSIPTVEDISVLNPSLEMELTHGVSFKGFHGVNLSEAYTIAARSYDPSMTGIIAPSSTPDAGCGVNKCLSMEPRITSVRGYVDVCENDKDLDKLKDVNLFSPGELSMTTSATYDDPTRLGHAIKQSKHVIPVEDSDPVLVTNGSDEVTRFNLSSDFAVNAEEDGVVEKIDKDLDLMIVKYKSGKCRAVSLDTNIVKNGGGGMYLNNQMTTDLKEGQRFKKDDVIAYHRNFFTNSKYNNCRMNMGPLIRCAIMQSYNTYEDGTCITEDVSERCGTKMTDCKQVVIGKNSNILSMAKEGSHIEVGDTLLAFDTSYDDSDLNALLASLGTDEELKSMVTEGSKNRIRAKEGGQIIKIKMYSTVDLEEMSPSLQKIFKAYYAKIDKKKKLLESYDKESADTIVKCGLLFTESNKKVIPNKFGTIRGQKVEDSVLIEFYIEEMEPLEIGSKIANFSGLKNTIDEVIPEGYEPYSDYLPHIKYGTTIAPNSILKRMTPSIIKVGWGNKLVVGFKEYLREKYADKL